MNPPNRVPLGAYRRAGDPARPGPGPDRRPVRRGRRRAGRGATVERGLGARHALLRHRPAVRRRAVRTPRRRGAAQAAARRVHCCPPRSAGCCVPGERRRRRTSGRRADRRRHAVFDFSRDGVRALVSRKAWTGSAWTGSTSLHLHDPDDHFDAGASPRRYPALARPARARALIRRVSAGMNQRAIAGRAGRARGDLDCVLLAGRYTLLDQSGLAELLPLCARARRVGDRGRRLQLRRARRPAAGRHVRLPPGRAGRCWPGAGAGAAVCERHGVPLRAAALQFPLGHPAVAAVLVGARSPEEVDDAVRWPSVDIPASCGAISADGLRPRRSDAVIIDAHHHLWTGRLPVAGRARPDARSGATTPSTTCDAASTTAGVDRHRAGRGRPLDDAAETAEFLAARRATPGIAGVVGWAVADRPGAGRHPRRPPGRAAAATQLVGRPRPGAGRRPTRAAGPARRARGPGRGRGRRAGLRPGRPRRPAAGRGDGAAAALPEPRFVLDHLGKPPIARRRRWAAWRDGSAAAGRRAPNVVAKLSGLVTEADWARLDGRRPAAVRARPRWSCSARTG